MLFNFICRTVLTPAKPYTKLQLSHQFTTKSSNPHSFTVSYLINSCGLPPDSAILAPKRLDLSKSLKTADSVLAFFTNKGFTKSQISKLISKHPNVLLSDPVNTLLPNFQILESVGLPKRNLIDIVTARPKLISNAKFQETAPSCVDFLKSVLQSDDKVINAIKRYPLALTYDLQVYGAENIRILLDAGVPNSTIQAMLAWQPRTFFTSADRFRKVVKDVLDMGFDPSKVRFLWAIHAIRAMSKSTWYKKVEIYMKWGWSKDEIFIAFEKYPGCMIASTDKITRILDFLVNTMGWKPSYIVQWPIVMCFSLEKRVIPRCLVYQYLGEKGVIEENEGFNFTKWLMYSDTLFLKWVVKRYEEEASEILKVYRKHLKEADK
ncbi:transcription termination factor MTERF15, mitochondrial-like [Bidens hawaiensis]|uniref:transcription termination factor MTERF15, mitochondrial-like n=1 Tax=Bidens hawaiensis TaxID=980011 RepID=UPI00404B4F40